MLRDEEWHREAKTNMTVSDQQLKEVGKTAIVEVLEERSDLIRDIVEDALEDIAMTKAIQEGEDSELVSRGEVLGLFEESRTVI